MLATNQPAALSNLVQQTTGVSVDVPDPNDPVEQQYRRLLQADDEAQEEADKWIRDNQEFAAKGAGLSREELNRRIRNRFTPVKEAYEDFISRNPKHVRARIAFGSFLNDLNDEDGAKTQFEKALELDPKNPAIYNNLADIYSHSGPIEKAFEYLDKAIELSPQESVYYHNQGTVVYLFRKESAAYYHLTEDQIFKKAFSLYSNAMRLDPDNFPLASDVAQTYYGIRPMKTEEALNAWTNAFKIAHNDVEREGVHLHFARVKMGDGKFSEAWAHLNAVTNGVYSDLKTRLERNLRDREAKPASTNAPAPPETKP
jgi:tetratricopeptide (TPR) repeat protein